MVLAALSLFQRITTYVDWVGVQGGCMSEGVLSLQMLWTRIFLKTVFWISEDIPLTNLVPGVLISTDDR